MFTQPILKSCAALAIVFAAFGAKRSAAQAPPPADTSQGVEILTRGPVHEAFAEIVTYNPAPGMIVPKLAPAIIEEIPPDERPDGDNVTWIPGYWAWDDERSDYLWVSGIWRALPPGRQWVPGYWAESGQGYQWSSGYWADAATTEVEYLPQPPPTVEIGPNIAAPSDSYGWVPGCWVWRSNRYAWRPGYWAEGRANWVWVPSHYVCAPRGYVYSDGYWDHSVQTRGVVFAPVYFQSEVYSRPHYSYAPTIAINISIFAADLFVRPRSHHYYFGDYYSASYHDEGFYASFSYGSDHNGYDPFYSHERWEHRSDRDWDRHRRDEYDYRRDHEDARPPRTYNIQNERNTVNITNITNNTNITNINTSDARNFQVAAPLEQFGKRKDNPIRLRQVNTAEKQAFTQRAVNVQTSRIERQKIESKPGIPIAQRQSKNARPERVKMAKSAIVAAPINKLSKDQVPPKRPDAPKVDRRVKPGAVPKADTRNENLRSKQPVPAPEAARPQPGPTPPNASRSERPVQRTQDPAKAQPKAERPDPKPEPRVNPSRQPGPTSPNAPRAEKPVQRNQEPSKAQPKAERPKSDSKPTPSQQPSAQPRRAKPAPVHEATPSAPRVNKDAPRSSEPAKARPKSEPRQQSAPSEPRSNRSAPKASDSAPARSKSEPSPSQSRPSQPQKAEAPKANVDKKDADKNDTDNKDSREPGRPKK